MTQEDFLKNYFEEQKKSDIEVERIEIDPTWKGVRDPEKLPETKGRLGFPEKNPCDDDFEIAHVQEDCPITGRKIDIHYPVIKGPIPTVTDREVNRDVARTSPLPVHSKSWTYNGPVYQTPLEKKSSCPFAEVCFSYSIYRKTVPDLVRSL